MKFRRKKTPVITEADVCFPHYTMRIAQGGAKHKRVAVKLIIAAVVALASFGASAECWVVGDMKGYTQFAPTYDTSEDVVVGVYHVNIDAERATLSADDDSYNSGLIYKPTSDSSMIGSASDSALTETWAITQDGKVLYTKVRVSQSGANQISSFVGDVLGKR